MSVDRDAALSHFLGFLTGNPEGDSVARAMVLGACAPLGIEAAMIYAVGASETLDLVGAYGFEESEAANYRSLPIGMPIPVCDAFRTMTSVLVRPEELIDRYPILAPDTGLIEGTATILGRGDVLGAPIIFSGHAVGALILQHRGRIDWQPADWAYSHGVASAVSMWMWNQRLLLIDRWRRVAPPPAREIRVTERQREILEFVGDDMTNAQIARQLGYAVPTIKKDLQEVMRLLGTHDRRSTAGRAREIGLLPERRTRP